MPSYALCSTRNAIKRPFTALTAFVSSSPPRFPRHVLRSDLLDSSPQFLQVNARDDILGDTCCACSCCCWCWSFLCFLRAYTARRDAKELWKASREPPDLGTRVKTRDPPLSLFTLTISLTLLLAARNTRVVCPALTVSESASEFPNFPPLPCLLFCSPFFFPLPFSQGQSHPESMVLCVSNFC